MTTDAELAWLVGASYEAGRVTLNMIRTKNLEEFHWVDSNFHPHYISEKNTKGSPVKKIDLFSQNERTLYKVNATRDSKIVEGWELDIDPALSYVYDKGLRFGALHSHESNVWMPRVSLEGEHSVRFDALFGEIEQKDPLKYALLKEAYSYVNQPVPRISLEKLGLVKADGSDEDYYNAFLLSRIANLPISRTYRNHTVSEWIRSMLYTYYRAHNILIPNSEELNLGDTRRYVTGALTIAPESGTYFNMHVLDYESLYPGCIDVFNLSYETIRCHHPECQRNLVPGLDYNICTRRRGIYSALIGALRDLRLRGFKPLSRTILRDTEGEKMKAASRILKVSSYHVTA